MLFRNEEIDELDRRAGLAAAMNGLANQHDLADLYAVVGRRNDDAALSEAALVEPFHPVGGKHHLVASRRPRSRSAP